MTSIHSEADIVLFGTLNWNDEWLNKDTVVLPAGCPIGFTNGMNFILQERTEWNAQACFKDVIVSVTVPSDHDFNLIPELRHNRHASNYQLHHVESAGSLYPALLANVNKYDKHWQALTLSERRALQYGIATAAGSAITGWKTAAVIADMVTPGGPLIPFFGICEAAISGIFTSFAAENHVSSVKAAQKAARDCETALVLLQNTARDLGVITPNARIYTPEIKSFTDLLNTFYTKDTFNYGNNFSRPTTLENMIIGTQYLPGYHGA